MEPFTRVMDRDEKLLCSQRLTEEVAESTAARWGGLAGRGGAAGAIGDNDAGLAGR